MAAGFWIAALVVLAAIVLDFCRHCALMAAHEARAVLSRMRQPKPTRWTGLPIEGTRRKGNRP